MPKKKKDLREFGSGHRGNGVLVTMIHEQQQEINYHKQQDSVQKAYIKLLEKIVSEQADMIDRHRIPRKTCK